MDVVEFHCEMDTRAGSQVLLCQTPDKFPCHKFCQKISSNYRNRCRRRFDAFYENRRVAFGLNLECLWDVIMYPWWRMRKWGRHRLAFLLVILMLIAPYGEAGESPLSYRRSSRKVCSTINVMNDIASFAVLKDCEVIEGNLQIVLVATNNCSKLCEEQINNITFPKLREVTGYVVFWRVKAIRSLGSLFPNLSVIRGRELFINYALVAYEMSSLEDIGLYSLTHILRGSVRFDVNLRLCFMKTINWDMIAKHGANRHYFGSARPEHECPRCPEISSENELCPLSDAGTPLCWNKNHCQKDTRSCDKSSTGECCHESCLGGCDGKSSKDCYACRGVMLNSDCVEKCPPNTYKYVDRRCVTADECIRIRKPYNWELLDVMKPYPFRPVQDVCSMECPANFLEEEVSIPNTELKQYRCVPCKGRCKKECPGAKVDSIASIQKLYGCTHIVGSLEIELRTGGNIVEELEKSLSSIEEISGYLKVARSLPLVSLYFLKSLKLIKGEKYLSKKFAFVVLDNDNLEELWDWSEKEKEMTINGGVSCNYNPKLCYEKIEKFQKIAVLPPGAEFLASEDTNGDKVACSLHQLTPNVSQKKADSVVIKWQRFQHYDQRELLGYAIYYTEAPHRNVSLYHNRNACSGDGWITDDIPNPEDDKQEEISFFLKGLKPFTQYAYYIKTYMTRSGKKGAQSEILYFITNPGTPSKPEKLLAYSNSTSEIVITWKPPTEPNGNLTHYKLSGFVLNKPVLEGNNSCPEHKDEPREKESQPQIVKPIPKMDGETCVCPTRITPGPSGIKDTEDIRVSKIEFEDALQTAYFSKRKKDRIKREMTHTDANHEQQLLRQFSSVNRKFLGEKSEPPEMLAFSQIVPLTTTQIVIKNLNYFTDYVVKVTACRELVEDEYDSHPACSGNSTIVVTTRKNENADNITDFTLIQNMVNGTLGELRLKWEEPQNPNGGILYYKIQYRLVGSEKALPLYDCISRKSFLEQKKEFVVKNLHPGNYSVRVLATSLAGDGPYSPSKSFYIAQPSQSTTDIWSGVFGAFIVSGIIFAIFLFWKRKTNVVPKLFANVNPEYVSAATVYVPDEWEVPRKNIELIRELGQGSFGMVYEGIARDIVPGQPEVKCAVKTVNEVATDRDRMEFLNEASVMKAFNTHHVVQLLGVVSEGQPTLVVMELMVNGDLKTYLRSHRPEFCEDKRKQPPTLKRILGMAIEIADGMAYLAAKKFVHRDLAARNCMVAEDLTVKIGDFGMTRDIYETDYYKKGTKGLLPVRWMAPESLKDGVFTTYSDVWSYGVVLWEMVTLASQPYQGLSNDQVLRYVIEGGVMERPENCPDKLYELMKLCWQYKPTARPHFMDFVSALLLDASPEFCKYSYYHSAEGRELRAHLETIDTELILPTPETPLKLATDIEDFSVGGSEPELDEDEEEAELDVEPPFVSPQRNILSSGVRTESWMKNRTKAAALASVSSSDSSRASKLSNGGANTPVNGYLVGSSSNGTRTTQC